MEALNKQTTVESIRECWALLFPFAISDRQIGIWLVAHDPQIIRKGISSAGLKYERLNGAMNLDHALRFASSVMNRMTAESNQGAA